MTPRQQDRRFERAARLAAARDMRAAGTKLREIAERFGVSIVTALNWTDPDHYAKQQAYARRGKQGPRDERPCEECGGVVDYFGRGRPPKKCSRCRPRCDGCGEQLQVAATNGLCGFCSEEMAA